MLSSQRVTLQQQRPEQATDIVDGTMYVVSGHRLKDPWIRSLDPLRLMSMAGISTPVFSLRAANLVRQAFSQRQPLNPEFHSWLGNDFTLLDSLRALDAWLLDKEHLVVLKRQ